MPGVGLLPLFGSPSGVSSGVPSGPSGGGGRKTPGLSGGFRLTEKFVLLLVFSAFITLCFGAIFFLPDSTKLLSGVFFHSAALQQQQQQQPQQPPAQWDQRSHVGAAGGGSSSSSYGADATGAAAENLAKIREDHERALREAKETLQKLPEEIRRDIHQDKDKFLLQDRLGREEAGAAGLPDLPFSKPVGAVGEEPADPITRQRRAKIKEVGDASLAPFYTVPGGI